MKTTIYEENCYTTIDLIFITSKLTNKVIKCNIDEVFESDLDHLFILTFLKLIIIDFISTSRRNFN